MRVPYEEMYNEFVRVLLKYGFNKEKAEISAKLYADASRDGVYTHGLNRFPKFIKTFIFSILDFFKVRLFWLNELNYYLNKHFVHTPGSISFQVKCNVSKSISF